jgi:hypothetical protein
MFSDAYREVTPDTRMVSFKMWESEDSSTQAYVHGLCPIVKKPGIDSSKYWCVNCMRRKK